MSLSDMVLEAMHRPTRVSCAYASCNEVADYAEPWYGAYGVLIVWTCLSHHDAAAKDRKLATV